MSTSRPVRAARRAERGHALLLVALVSSFVLGLFVVAWRSTHDAIEVEAYQEDRVFRDDVITESVGLAIQLLRTGRPPTDPTRFVTTTILEDGTPYYTLVSIETYKGGKAQGNAWGIFLGGAPGKGKGFDGTWEVYGSPGTYGDLQTYGPPPDRFDSSPGNSGHNR